MCKRSLYLVPIALVLALLLGNTASAELIAHWPLTGDYKDATGNGHDGTPLGDPEFVLDVEKELVLEVDGDDRVMVEDAPNCDDSDCSMQSDARDGEINYCDDCWKSLYLPYVR